MIISVPSGHHLYGCITTVKNKIKDTLRAQNITKTFINNVITIVSNIHYNFNGEELNAR